MSIESISSNPAMIFTSDTVRTELNQTSEHKPIEPIGEVKKSESEPRQGNTKDNLSEIVDRMNKFLDPGKTTIKFELHEKLHEYYVTVVDEKTNEILREIPSKRMLDIYAAMTEFVGLVVDKKI